MLYFEGKIEKSGRWWAISCDALSIRTQGTSRKNAFDMLKDAIDGCLVEDGSAGVKIIFDDTGEERFAFRFDNLDELLPMIYERLRWKHDLSLADLAQKLGNKSRTSVHRYMTCKSQPTIGKFEEIMNAMGFRLTISPMHEKIKAANE